MPYGRENVSGGRWIDICHAENRKQMVSSKGIEGYDFAIMYASHPRCCLNPQELSRRAQELFNGPGDLLPKSIIDQLLPQIEIADISLTSHDWSRLVVAKPSPWIDPDSDDPYLRRISEEALNEELTYFGYLSVPAIIIRLRGPNNANMARIVYHHLIENPTSAFSVWVEVPAVAPTSAEDFNGHADNDDTGDSGGRTTVAPQTPAIPTASAAGEIANADGVYEALLREYDGPEEPATTKEEPPKDTWHWFYEFRRACNSHRRVFLVLELTADLPDSETEIARWKGEPLSAIKFDTHTFLSNRGGFPVLSRAHQAVAKEFFLLNVQCVVDGPTLHVRRPPKPRGNEPPEPPDPMCLYYAYLNNLWRNNPRPTQAIEWASGYEDYLQLPLQPLGDHLESEVYETFERDPTKYQQYFQALEEAVAVKRQSLPSDETLIVMILGAGRGGLVGGSLEALRNSDMPFKMIAVEKNPCAVVTLNTKRVEEWDEEVEIVFSDMREYRPGFQADIVISELLGSFGCNELSPECLDGALHLMKRDCICIPCHYRSYIAPVHSPKLLNEIRSTSEKEYNPLTAFESPYVCRVFNQFEIANPKALFRFNHPNWNLGTNDRSEKVEFTARESCEMMGLVGYFYAVLFGRMSLSTVPRYETSGLCSWFPILFALQTPIYVKKGERIRVRFWRRSNKSQVWYEWQILTPVMTPIMNPGGRSNSIRLH